jgi:hypothetical protein
MHRSTPCLTLVKACDAPKRCGKCRFAPQRCLLEATARRRAVRAALRWRGKPLIKMSRLAQKETQFTKALEGGAGFRTGADFRAPRGGLLEGGLAPLRAWVRRKAALEAGALSMLHTDGDNSTTAAESDMTSSLLCN